MQSKKSSRKSATGPRPTSVDGDTPLMKEWAPELQLDGTTKYAAVAAALEKGIQDGHLKPGMRLPPQRDIADYFNVTIATVTKAIGLATRRGLVHARAGSGTFIAQDTRDTEVVPAPGAVFGHDLSLNAPPLSVVSDILQENLKELWTDHSASQFFDYEPIPGGRVHRLAASRWLALRGLNAQPDNILVTHGAHEGLLACLAALTKPGDVVLCERLNYTGLRRIGHLLRIRLVGVEVDHDGLLADALPALVAQLQPKAIVCTPITQNPTTATLSDSRRSALVSVARNAGIPIIEDDIYGHFAGHRHSPLAAIWPEGVILVTSLSKVIASGLRVGYVLAAPSLLPRIIDAMFMLGWTAPLAQMTFATKLIESGRAEQCIAMHREEAGQRMRLAQSILGANLRTSFDVPAYHAWIDTAQTRLEDITSELYRQGIQISPASHFLIGDGSVPPAIRVSLGRVVDASALEAPLGLIAHRLSVSRGAALGSIA